MQVFMAINILMEKLEKLNKDLDSMMNKKRVTNPIVGNVLAIAAKVMGLPKHDERTTITTMNSLVINLNDV